MKNSHKKNDAFSNESDERSNLLTSKSVDSKIPKGNGDLIPSNSKYTWKNLENRRGEGVGGGLVTEWLSPLVDSFAIALDLKLVTKITQISTKTYRKKKKNLKEKSKTRKLN